MKKNKLINWLESIAIMLPAQPSFLNQFLEKHKIIEKAFTGSPFLTSESDFDLKELPGRTAVFIKEARKQGFQVQVYRNTSGFTNYFKIKKDNKSFLLEGFPRAEFLSGKKYQFIDNKSKVKQILSKNNFPVAKGRAFWFFQKKKALGYANSLGFPLIVKPTTGSLGRKVFTNIKNLQELKHSIKEVTKGFPVFMIERFLTNVSDYRITVVDFKETFCFERIPANVIGDGKHNITELRKRKNNNSKRGTSRNIKTPWHNIVINQDTKKILKKQKLTLSSVPKKERKVLLQKNPFLKLGGDPVDKTSQIHPDNKELFCKIARLFDARVVGIDFLVKDISRSFKEQNCAVLELNSLPGIIGHHFPYKGNSQNVAKAIMDLFLKYYVN